ncbi:MAG TPA: YetF domain-containing protein [Candidatus Limnocylindrales bacterium]|nr:YetF domain-containing protein [Candidatus Limnocylindrales bacterium]
MFTLTLSPLELVLRSVVVYVLFLAALRLSGKRELGQFTIFDLALVLLASNALQPAITGPEASLPGAAIIIATLFTLNRLTAFARRRSVLARRILDYAPTVLARDGKWIDAAIGQEDLDTDDLQAAIREYGLESVKEVKLATLEHDGSISVVPEAGPFVHMRHRRRYRRRPNVSQ